MILLIIRLVFVLAVLAIAFGYATTDEVLARGEWFSPTTKVTLVILIPFMLALGMILADTVIHNKSLTSISGLFFGLVAGVVLAYVLGLVVDLVASVFIQADGTRTKIVAGAEDAPAPDGGAASHIRVTPLPDGSVDITVGDPRPGATSQPTGWPVRRRRAAADDVARGGGQSVPALVAMIKLLVGACAIFLCVSFVMQTKDDFRFVIPYLEFAKETKGQHPFLLDTSVIIDGRIADIADTRILESPLVVPRFVLEELQDIADSSDKLKRNRGRRGLDMLNRLQSNDKIDVRLVEARVGPVEEVSEVDHKLVAFAQYLNGRIVTNDYNLNKVAQLRGVEVININDLANALKPVVLPGEVMTIKIIKPGEEMGQGIGYLDDGTMVVAEQGRDYIGREMSLVVTSTLQTSAGRMIFGRPASDEDHPGPTRERTT